MPSNQQRRAAAKRKLERQLANRAERARKRRRLTVAMSAVGVIALVAAVGGVYYLTREDEGAESTAAQTQDPSQEPAAPSTAAPAPPMQPKPATVSCTYDDSPRPAATSVEKPRTEGIRTDGDNATLSISMDTSQGPIGLTLNNTASPCTVNSFASLTGQGYFDGTECHRLTEQEGLKVLQCGDPLANGQGGPGYQFANEYPTDQYSPEELPLQPRITYPRGTIAMANVKPGTNGSQFFLVYADTQLQPNFTIFGTIDETGLTTLDKIAAGGQDQSEGPTDGKPNLPVTLNSVQID